MHAVLKTKVLENGVIPEYCSCEKIGAYVLGSLQVSSVKITGTEIDQNLENGLYIISIIDNGRKVASGKLIIVK